VVIDQKSNIRVSKAMTQKLHWLDTKVKFVTQP